MYNATPLDIIIPIINIINNFGDDYTKYNNDQLLELITLNGINNFDSTIIIKK